MDAVEINTSESPQNEEGIVSAMEICRVCLLGNLLMRDLFHDNGVASLSAKAMSFTNVKMLPGDGLPGQVCCDCADKLEAAYDFKLQVEQADSVLREKFDTLNIKEELFFNDVEVHLEGERTRVRREINDNGEYVEATESLHDDGRDTLLKDHLALLQVEKIAEQESMLQHGVEHLQEQLQEELHEGELEEEDLQEEEQLQEQHLQEQHLQEEHLQEQHLQEQHLQEHHLQEHHLQEHHLQEHHLQEHHLQEQQMQEEHLQEEHLQEEHLQEQLQDDDDLADDLDKQPNDELLHLQQISQSVHNFSDQQQQQQQQQQQHGIKDENLQDVESENIQEQNYLDQQECSQMSDDDFNNDEPFADSQESMEYSTMEKEGEMEQEQNQDQDASIEQMEHDSPESETRRIRRKVIRQSTGSEHNSDEENYFENLNLSSRLKKTQDGQSEKVFFMCYLCDKEFLSKGILKEHMHSHEEVRRTLSLKKVENKLQKPVIQQKVSPQKVPVTPQKSALPLKTPPSGKKANKCPYCGKEYLYIISFNKHIKQHEKDKDVKKSEFMAGDDDSVDYVENVNSIGVLETSIDDNDSESENEKESEVYQCEKCPEKFSNRRALQKHGVKHINLKCSVCDVEYESFEKLNEHRIEHVTEGVLTEDDLRKDAEEWNALDDKSETDQKNELKCPHCTLLFSYKKSLLKHIETHANKFTCKVCGNVFMKREHLSKHLESHVRPKSFKCTECTKVFGNELTLRNHLIATSHKTILQGEEYDPNKRLKRVAAKAAQKIIDKIKIEDESDFDEEAKKKDVNYQEELKSPSKRTYSKKLFECETCTKKCSSKQSLTKHMELHVKDEKSDKIKLEKKDPEKFLDDTDDTDDRDDDFESGLDWPMDNHECPTCKKRYSTKKSLLRHQLLHEEPNFECDICNVKFYRKDKLKAHYDKCSEKNPDQVRKCNICGDSFENNEILREHRAKHVTEGILTEEDLREIEPRPEERKSGEKIPRKRRTDIVGLECTECNKQYTSRKGLLRHIQVHEGKKYLCDICPKKFYRREHLKIHVAKHNMIKPYKCTRCTKRFIKEEQLTNHLSKHDRNFKKNKETDSSKRFLCEICSKSFTQSTTLIAHLRAHNGIKPYVCEVCSRPFTTNAYLKMHMRTHTQERPYICQFCSRAFARADTLANHLTSHTGEAKYHCKFCPKNFRRLKSLKEHVFIHTGQRPYACPTCDRRFNNNGSRYAHSKRCKQNMLQNQNRAQLVSQVPQQQIQIQQHQQQQQQQHHHQQQQQHQKLHQTIVQSPLIKSQNIKTITIARQAEPMTAQHVMQHQEILMPLILPLTVTLADVGEEVILPEGTKIFTTS
ncbi:zinc finger protein 91-like isoform X2 [Leptopilina heterotoma]|uniref:zinc finger protein 91-like isoform X2 n=1 Tax=Leptopilina heterotoma TaxID=63436 RepID=UPI001CAA29B6|nr:zinc finger protein 91-like isoform X2 [Leptopilina heterotoma]